MYVLKTEGTDKIPDYVQIRDDSFSLITHFKIHNIEKTLIKIGYDNDLQSVTEIIKKLPYGKLQKI